MATEKTMTVTVTGTFTVPIGTDVSDLEGKAVSVTLSGAVIKNFNASVGGNDALVRQGRRRNNVSVPSTMSLGIVAENVIVAIEVPDAPA